MVKRSVMSGRPRSITISDGRFGLDKSIITTTLASMRICKASVLVLLFALIAAVPRSQAQQLDLIANTDARQIISLDGQWKTIIDPYESGYYDYRYQPSTNGYFKDAKPKTKTDLIEYDFDTSESLTVPGDWNTQKDRLF